MSRSTSSRRAHMLSQERRKAPQKLTETSRYYGVRLRDLPTEMRPRERLLREGAQRLDHVTLLSLLLGTGRSADEDVLMIARRIMSCFGSLRALSSADLDSLCSVHGVGPAKAARLIAAFELTRRALDLNQHDQESGELTDPSGLSVELTLAALAREHWDEHSSLLIGCSLPSEISLDELSRTVESAVTLSLDGSLCDVASHGRWLARLLHEDPDASWCLIALQPADALTRSRSSEPTPAERESAVRLQECAALLNLNLYSLISTSEEQTWVLIEALPDDQR